MTSNIAREYLNSLTQYKPKIFGYYASDWKSLLATNNWKSMDTNNIVSTYQGITLINDEFPHIYIKEIKYYGIWRIYNGMLHICSLHDFNLALPACTDVEVLELLQLIHKHNLENKLL